MLLELHAIPVAGVDSVCSHGTAGEAALDARHEHGVAEARQEAEVLGGVPHAVGVGLGLRPVDTAEHVAIHAGVVAVVALDVEEVAEQFAAVLLPERKSLPLCLWTPGELHL